MDWSEMPGLAPGSEPIKVPFQTHVNGKLMDYLKPCDDKPKLTTGLSSARSALNAANRYKHSWPFQKPVFEFGLDLPDYPTIVGEPMDLLTIRKELDSGVYTSQNEVVGKVNTMLFNCMVYNKPNEDVHAMCRGLACTFRDEVLSFSTPDVRVYPNTGASASSASRQRKKRRNDNYADLFSADSPANNEHAGNSKPVKKRRTLAQIAPAPVAVTSAINDEHPVVDQRQSLPTIDQPPLQNTNDHNQNNDSASANARVTPVLQPPPPQPPQPPPQPQCTTSSELMDKCLAVVEDLLTDPEKFDFTKPFHHPIDRSILRIDDYHQVIKNPMDLTLIKRKIIANAYNDNIEPFISDLRLIISNCYDYNGRTSFYGRLGKKLELAIEAHISSLYDPEVARLRRMQEMLNLLKANCDQLQSNISTFMNTTTLSSEEARIKSLIEETTSMVQTTQKLNEYRPPLYPARSRSRASTNQVQQLPGPPSQPPPAAAAIPPPPPPPQHQQQQTQPTSRRRRQTKTCKKPVTIKARRDDHNDSNEGRCFTAKSRTNIRSSNHAAVVQSSQGTAPIAQQNEQQQQSSNKTNQNKSPPKQPSNDPQPTPVQQTAQPNDHNQQQPTITNDEQIITPEQPAITAKEPNDEKSVTNHQTVRSPSPLQQPSQQIEQPAPVVCITHSDLASLLSSPSPSFPDPVEKSPTPETPKYLSNENDGTKERPENEELQEPPSSSTCPLPQTLAMVRAQRKLEYNYDWLPDDTDVEQLTFADMKNFKSEFFEEEQLSKCIQEMPQEQLLPLLKLIPNIHEILADSEFEGIEIPFDKITNEVITEVREYVAALNADYRHLLSTSKIKRIDELQGRPHPDSRPASCDKPRVEDVPDLSILERSSEQIEDSWGRDYTRELPNLENVAKTPEPAPPKVEETRSSPIPEQPKVQTSVDASNNTSTNNNNNSNNLSTTKQRRRIKRSSPNAAKASKVADPTRTTEIRNAKKRPSRSSGASDGRPIRSSEKKSKIDPTQQQQKPTRSASKSKPHVKCDNAEDDPVARIQRKNKSVAEQMLAARVEKAPVAGETKKVVDAGSNEKDSGVRHPRSPECPEIVLPTDYKGPKVKFTENMEERKKFALEKRRLALQHARPNPLLLQKFYFEYPAGQLKVPWFDRGGFPGDHLDRER